MKDMLAAENILPPRGSTQQQPPLREKMLVKIRRFDSGQENEDQPVLWVWTFWFLFSFKYKLSNV